MGERGEGGVIKDVNKTRKIGEGRTRGENMRGFHPENIYDHLNEKQHRTRPFSTASHKSTAGANSIVAIATCQQ